MVTCSICFESTQEVGEIDSCFHRFCWSCINQWADRESRCPLCKQRFKRIRRKALGVTHPAAEPPSKRRKLSKGATADHSTVDADCPKTPPQPGDEAPTAQPAAAGLTAVDAADSAEEPASPKGELSGVVLEERRVRAKDQVYMPEDDAEDLQELVDTVHCMVCGADDNDEFLLICDGCDNGYHTYCVNRRTVPLGDWFCPECVEEHRSTEQSTHQHTVAGRAAGRQQEQEMQRASTRRAAARAPAGAIAGAGRRRLRRGGSSSVATEAAGAGDDEVDLTLFDSDLESESEGQGLGERVRSTAGAVTVSDVDDDFEFELHDEDTDEDWQDSDWEGQPAHSGRSSSTTRAPSSRSAAAGHSSRVRERHRGASGSGVSGGRRLTAGGNISTQGHADTSLSPLARSAGRPAGTATAGARATAAAGRDGARLKSWQELRAEEEQEASAGGTVAAAAAATAAAAGSRGAAERATSSTRTSLQLVDLLQTVNRERRIRQSQLAAAAVGRDGMRAAGGEEQAWAALDQVRSSGAAGYNTRNSSRGTMAPLARRSGRSAAAAAAPIAQQRVASGYFGSAMQQQQQQQAGHDSTIAGSAQQQREAQLRQALLARLQQQKRQRQQQQQAGRQAINAQLATSDPRDPEYMDIIRGSISAARDKGEEDRRRRQAADAAAVAAALPAGTVSAAQRSQSRGAAAARRMAGIKAAAAGAAANRAAAVVQVESRLARSMSAAGQRDVQQQRRQQLQQPGAWRHNSSSFMNRWLDKGASSHDADRLGAPAVVAGSSREHVTPTQLPRSVRTLGAVKRGAAVQAAAVAAAGAAGDQPYVPGGRQQQQHQASRQPLELQPSCQEQQQQRQQPCKVATEGLQQPESKSRYFAGAQPANAQQGHQLQTWQHQLMLSHLRPAASQQHQHLPLMPPGVPGPQQCIPAPPTQQQQHYHTGTTFIHQQCCPGVQPWVGGVAEVGKPGYAAETFPQHLLHSQQPVNSNTSNSSETVSPPGGGTAPAAVAGTPCSAWMLSEAHQHQPVMPEQLQHVQQPLEVHQHRAQDIQRHCQQQPDLHLSLQNPSALEGKPLPVPSAAAHLTREQLKSAKSAASSIVKARLRPLFQAQQIEKGLYIAAAKMSTHGLYELVKQGTLGLQDVIAAAEGAGSSKRVVYIMEVADRMLVSAGVPVDAGG